MAKPAYNTKKLHDALIAVTTQGKDIDYPSFSVPKADATLAKHLSGVLYGYGGSDADNAATALTLTQQKEAAREEDANRERSGLTNVFDWMSAPMYAVQ